MSGIIEDAYCIKEQGIFTKRVERTPFFFLCLVIDDLQQAVRICRYSETFRPVSLFLSFVV